MGVYKYYLNYVEHHEEFRKEFNHQDELLSFLEGKDYTHFDVVYGYAVKLVPKEKVTAWEISDE